MLAVLAALLAATGLVACGTDNNTAAKPGPSGTAVPAGCARGTITGAGSTFVQTIMQQWIKDFGAKCDAATVNYQGVGSGAGIQQFTSGTVDFGASDVVMKPEEESAAEATGGRVLHIPWSAGAIAVMYNLSEVKGLRLSGQTLAAIYAGRVTRWDDRAIADENPGVNLPAEAIQVVHRSDGSGTTSVFTSYVSAVAPAVWTAGAGKDVAWPAGQGAKGSDGVTAVVKQARGAIGYAELSFPASNGLGIVQLRNAAGAYVAPSAAAVSAALAGSEVPDDLKVKVSYAPSDPAAYPLSTVTWAIVFARPGDAGKAGLLKAFLTYALGPGQDAAAGLFYAPLPANLRDRARAAVATMAAG